MSSTRAAGKGREKPPLPSCSRTTPGKKLGYDLRNTKGKTLADMFGGASGGKRPPSSPEEKEQRKVFLMDRDGESTMSRDGQPTMNRDGQPTLDQDYPEGKDDVTKDQPTNRDGESTMSRDGQPTLDQDYPEGKDDVTKDQPTNQKTDQQMDPEDKPTKPVYSPRHEAMTKIGQLIIDMKKLTECKPVDHALQSLIDEAYTAGGIAGIFPASVTLDLIRQAKSAPNSRLAQEACDIKWPEDAYELTKFTTDRDTELQGNTLVVAIKRGQRPVGTSAFYDKVPGLGKLQDDSPKILTVTNTETINGIEESTTTTHIVTLDEDGRADVFVDMFKQLKDKLIASPGNIYATTTTGHPVAMRKAYEIALTDTNKGCSIITTGKTKISHQPTESVIVSPGEMTYAELLKNIRENVDGEELGVRILHAKQNPEGQLVMKIKGPTTNLTNTIKKAVPGATTTVRSNLTTMHVRDLEEDVTIEEIEAGIKRAIPEHASSKILVKSVRPAYNHTSRATVQLPPAAAKILDHRGHIQVGLISARIRIRTENQRCPRCWKDGHSLRDCKGEDMRNRCFRCHKEGHQKSNCDMPNKTLAK